MLIDRPEHPSPTSALPDVARVRIALALLSALGVLAAIWGMIVTGRVYDPAGELNDLPHFYGPLRLSYAQALAAGRSFLWDPGLRCGFYAHGEGQGGFMHPLHLLMYRALPFRAALDMETWLSYPVLWLGTYAFLRRLLGRVDAALFGSIAFAFSGSQLLHIHHLNGPAVFAQLPWLLLAIDTLLRDPRPRRAALAQCAAALIVGSQWLMGYPMWVWMSTLVAAGYTLFLMPEWVSVWRPTRLAFAMAAGFLIGGIQVVPTYDSLAHSYRAKPTAEFLATGSLDPANIVQFVAPYLFRSKAVAPRDYMTARTEYALYPGAVVTVLIASLIARPPITPTLRRMALASAMLGTVALLLCFGAYTPMFAISSRLPVLKLFRMPARYNAIVQFSTAILASIAYMDLTDSSSKDLRPRARDLILGLPLVASLTACAVPWALAKLRPGGTLLGNISPSWKVAAGPALIGLATWLVWRASRGSRPALAALAVMAAVDQGVYGLAEFWSRSPATLAALARDEPTPPTPRGHRVEGLTDLAIWDGTRLADGYMALEPSRRLDPEDPRARRLAGVGWIWEPPTGWVASPDPLPRVRLVAESTVQAGPEIDLEAIDLARSAIVESNIRLEASPRGDARILVDVAGRVEAETAAPSRQLAILSESYHEGWMARVDGQESAAIRVNGDFLGCVVPPGSHRVVWEFRPSSFRVGAAATALGLGATLVMLILGLRQAPRGRGLA